MNKAIKNIMYKNCTNEEKNKELDLLIDEITMAKEILSGKFKYCEKCDDYYLSESFLTKTYSREEKICVYKDYINSGGNAYADGIIYTKYSICPKGHKYEISRKEVEKSNL